MILALARGQAFIATGKEIKGKNILTVNKVACVTGENCLNLLLK